MKNPTPTTAAPGITYIIDGDDILVTGGDPGPDCRPATEQERAAVALQFADELARTVKERTAANKCDRLTRENYADTYQQIRTSQPLVVRREARE